MSHPILAKSPLLVTNSYESNASLYMMVTLDLTSSLPWPLEEDNLCKQQSTTMKRYRTQQYTGKKRSGLTPPTPYEPVKSKYALYI